MPVRSAGQPLDGGGGEDGGGGAAGQGGAHPSTWRVISLQPLWSGPL